MPKTPITPIADLKSGPEDHKVVAGISAEWKSIMSEFNKYSKIVEGKDESIHRKLGFYGRKQDYTKERAYIQTLGNNINALNQSLQIGDYEKAAKQVEECRRLLFEWATMKLDEKHIVVNEKKPQLTDQAINKEMKKGSKAPFFHALDVGLAGVESKINKLKPATQEEQQKVLIGESVGIIEDVARVITEYTKDPPSADTLSAPSGPTKKGP